VKRALITGGHGFVASNLARALLERGDAVTVLDRAAPAASGLRLQGIAAEVELVEADLRDAPLVETTVAAGQFDVVFHLAAQTLVGPAMADPTATFEVNVRGTWTLLEACRRAGVPAIVVASSDKAYGPSEELPYREEMPLRPASPYEASKAAADAIALSYRPAYGLPVAVTRFANIYGGGDPNFSRLIPEAIAAVLDGRRPQIRSDGSPERDFLFVDDAVAAYLAVEGAVGAGGPGAGEAFNAGGEQPHSVAEVLETIAEVSGAGLQPEYLGSGNPSGEIDRQWVDSTKLRQTTGWEPAVGLRDGLVRTLDWYRDHPQLRPSDRHERALHGHHQGHQEDRRPLPGRAGEGARARRRRSAGEGERQGRGRGQIATRLRPLQRGAEPGDPRRAVLA
jgi:CDP-glucose 4,6-dehydratase